MELKQIEIDELVDILDQTLLIDVRSPGEFAEFHIPGAINVPLFSNEERAEVGTLYKQKGPEQAKDRGVEIVSLKLASIYQKIKYYAKSYERTVIYCWRGGMRSKSVANFMTVMGVHCLQLKGGIRSFRKLVTDELEMFSKDKKPFVVIEGFTGSRKTDILHQLSEKGYPVIDLEGLAGHRGSIFGSVGLTPQSQKAFECELWLRLKALKGSAYYIIEGESKRIGRVVLPPFINEGKESGKRFFIDYPFEKRIEAIYEEYNPKKHSEELNDAYQHLKKYIKPPLSVALDELMEKQDYYQFIALLLEHYYDPRYNHQQKKYAGDSTVISIASVEEGVEKIEKQLNARYSVSISS
ncbi:tRNA 2-selenouridine synthase [Pullulanibacillus pueri]|uniref:tRNA 2-selenouridine synthase n=1 Tax=Pullulanibacillus pueri TaxID=1437324 RepID=A0A8J2ZW88_9BACL|nr:tRNA 2-selenouridine(34) synthase MnmH [Pullulanibacillus pueri]MBM7682280.1 tRNA 2-selenouridine synthase [Pullulanibacillus pueri]GGH80966.1 tRNA 2-selenouridine synthase [Pullulanibacillus pueri]